MMVEKLLSIQHIINVLELQGGRHLGRNHSCFIRLCERFGEHQKGPCKVVTFNFVIQTKLTVQTTDPGSDTQQSDKQQPLEDIYNSLNDQTQQHLVVM